MGVITPLQSAAPNDFVADRGYDFIAAPTGDAPGYLITVDTEEAFDWSKPFARTGHSLSHIAQLARFQGLCEKSGVRPLYLLDYPVVMDDRATDFFADLVRRKVADIGAHMHPWVTPPFDDVLTHSNSFSCNLPPEIERAKMLTLFEMMEKRLGIRPAIYRAGRYGIGDNGVRVLSECGVRFDTSVRATFDYSAEGGPDFADSPVKPYWLMRGHLAELPLTSQFTGYLRSAARSLFGRDGSNLHIRGILSRLNLLSRVALTPEGVSAAEVRHAIDVALRDRLSLLVLSFHSASVEPGNTPYVRNTADLERFYGWWDSVLSHLAVRGVRPTSLPQLERHIFGEMAAP